MTLEELKIQSEKDITIDDIECDKETVRTHALKIKYLRLFSKYRLQERKHHFDYLTLKKEKWEYYAGKASPEVYRDKPFDHKILRGDIPIYLESDEELNTLLQKKEYFETCKDYCEEVLKTINSRSFEIKNIINWRRFMEGMDE